MSNFKNNLKILIIVTILIKIIGFTYKILQARFLPFEVLSTISAINPIISLSLIISQMSIPLVLTSLISKKINHRAYYNRPLISKAIRINLISTSIVIIIMFFISTILSNTLYKNIDILTPILILFPSLYFSNMSAIIKSYLESHDKFKRTITANLLEAIIKISSILIIIILLSNLNSRQILIITSSFITFGEISSFFFLILKVKRLTKLYLVKEYDSTSLIKPGFTLTIFALVFSGYHFLEPMLYYFFTGHINIDYSKTNYIYTSIHSYCLPLFQISGFMTYIIIKIMTPALSKTNNLEENIPILNKIFLTLLFFEGLILIIIFNLGDFFLKIAYNKENLGYMMKILSLSTYLTFFSPIITMSFESHLKYKFLLKNALISSILGLLTISICSLIGNIALYAIFISGIISDLSYYILNILDFKKETTRLPFSYRNFILFFIPIILTLLQSVLGSSFSLICIIICYLFISFIFYLNKNKEPSFISDKE